MKITAPALCLLAALLLSTASWAGLFSVSPVRIYMSPRDRATAITINNDGDGELVMQADIYVWKQKPDGTDDLTLSEDLILSPPILKIAGKARQVVRLAMVGPPVATGQLTYRMILREIPEAQAADKKVELQIALAFSLPVFITPAGAKRDIECTVARAGSASVRATCENRGSAYAQPRHFTLSGTAGETLASRDAGEYILPGNRRSYEITRPEGRIPVGPAKLAVHFDDGTSQSYDVTVGD